MVFRDFKQRVVSEPAVTPALGKDLTVALIFAANVNGALRVRESHVARVESSSFFAWYTSKFF